MKRRKSAGHLKDIIFPVKVRADFGSVNPNANYTTFLVWQVDSCQLQLLLGAFVINIVVSCLRHYHSFQTCFYHNKKKKTWKKAPCRQVWDGTCIQLECNRKTMPGMEEDRQTHASIMTSSSSCVFRSISRSFSPVTDLSKWNNLVISTPHLRCCICPPPWQNVYSLGQKKCLSLTSCKGKTYAFVLDLEPWPQGVTWVFAIGSKCLCYLPPADLPLFNVKLVLVFRRVSGPSQKQ